MAQINLSIMIHVAEGLVVVNPAVPSGTVGDAYSHQFSVTGGAPPYRWSVMEGALPPGLTLTTEGLISGTPTAGGDYTAKLDLRDVNS